MSKVSGRIGDQNLTTDDKEAVESFRELAKVHKRQKKFLELRLRDPESLYEVSEVRAKLKPKKQALNDKQLVNKGMMKAAKTSDEKKPVPETMSKQQSDNSPSIKLPGDNENPDDVVY